MPIVVPPARGGDDGEPSRWWQRVPSGALLVVLLGAFVLWATLSQGADPFNGYLAIP